MANALFFPDYVNIGYINRLRSEFLTLPTMVIPKCKHAIDTIELIHYSTKGLNVNSVSTINWSGSPIPSWSQITHDNRDKLHQINRLGAVVFKHAYIVRLGFDNTTAPRRHPDSFAADEFAISFDIQPPYIRQLPLGLSVDEKHWIIL